MFVVGHTSQATVTGSGEPGTQDLKEKPEGHHTLEPTPQLFGPSELTLSKVLKGGGRSKGPSGQGSPWVPCGRGADPQAVSFFLSGQLGRGACARVASW